MKYAPIALFVYNRPKHTLRVLESLKKNYLSKKTIIYIFSDGPKKIKNKLKINLVRKDLKKIKYFKRKIIIQRKKNYGLAKSFIEGISYVLKKHKKVIVLEDDNYVSRKFLNYMNDALEMYYNDKKVCSISGYTYPLNFSKRFDTFFLRGADTWGWGTWRRSWSNFEPNGKKLLKRVKESGCEYDLNLYGALDLTKMLKDQIKRKNDSYTVRWIIINYLLKKYTLYPSKSFVQNIGNEGSGSHNLKSKIYDVKLFNKYEKLKKIEILEKKNDRIKISNYFFSMSKYYKFLKIFKIYKWFIYKIRSL